MSNLLVNEPCYQQFKTFGCNFFQPVFERLGWDTYLNESHLDVLLRSVVIQEIGLYGETMVLRKAQEQFTRFVKNPKDIHPDLRSTVLNLAACEGDLTTYEVLRKLEKEVELQEEKIRALLALTYFTQQELLWTTLELALSAEVRSQDTVKIVSSVSENPNGRELAWEFVKINWEEFNRRYGGSGSGFLLMMLIEAVTNHLIGYEKAQEVFEFFQTHPVPVADRTIKQSIERIRNNTNWLTQNRESLAKLLTSI
jgi:aminopeptidase N